MLWAILNKSWKQHPTKQQLYNTYSHLKNHWSNTIKTCGTLLEKKGQTHKWPLSIDVQVLLIYIRSVDVVWMNCWERWMIQTVERKKQREKDRQRQSKKKFFYLLNDPRICSKIERNIFMLFTLYLLSKHFMQVQLVQPYNSTDVFTAWKNFRFILSAW